MRAPSPILLLALTALLAGCAALSSEPPCVDDETRTQIRAALDRFERSSFGDEAMTVMLDGTMDGEDADATIAISPSQKALRVSSAEFEMRLKGTEYSIEELSGAEDAVTGYGRNHKPGSLYAEFLADVNSEEDNADFLGEVEFEDYEVACIESGATPLVELSYEDEDTSESILVERDGAHRPVQGVVKDTISDDNFRVSISYQEPTINVDTSLDRIQFTVVLESVSLAENARGGILETLLVEDGTEWVPLGQVLVQLSDGESVYREDTLRAGTVDWDDGDTFRFDDRDGNGLVSDGDRLTYDLGPGLVVAFWDDWADLPVDVVNQ